MDASAEGRAAVDSTAWDGNAAMSACDGAACYRAICAGRKTGPADERGSWALPHHKRPGAPPSAAGVRNSLSRLPQTQGLANREEARRHLEAHMRTIQAQAGNGRSDEEGDPMVAPERRYTMVAVELRGDDKHPKIGGYAAVFGKLSQNLGGFVEEVAPSFFNKSRGDGWPDVIARFDHENAFLLGTTAARTLELAIDEYGLGYVVDPPRARADIIELVQRGDVRKSSVAFRIPPEGDEWSLSDQGFPKRTLLTGQLVDVAPVISPAYTDTTAGLRSLASHFEADLEEVRSLAADNELRRFFIKTEAGMSAPKTQPKRRLSGAAALARVLERENSQL
jgi:HK97 family phage prohead protease